MSQNDDSDGSHNSQLTGILQKVFEQKQGAARGQQKLGAPRGQQKPGASSGQQIKPHTQGNPWFDLSHDARPKRTTGTPPPFFQLNGDQIHLPQPPAIGIPKPKGIKVRSPPIKKVKVFFDGYWYYGEWVAIDDGVYYIDIWYESKKKQIAVFIEDIEDWKPWTIEDNLELEFYDVVKHKYRKLTDSEFFQMSDNFEQYKKLFRQKQYYKVLYNGYWYYGGQMKNYQIKFPVSLLQKQSPYDSHKIQIVQKMKIPDLLRAQQINNLQKYDKQSQKWISLRDSGWSDKQKHQFIQKFPFQLRKIHSQRKKQSQALPKPLAVFDENPSKSYQHPLDTYMKRKLTHLPPNLDEYLKTLFPPQHPQSTHLNPKAQPFIPAQSKPPHSNPKAQPFFPPRKQT